MEVLGIILLVIILVPIILGVALFIGLRLFFFFITKVKAPGIVKNPHELNEEQNTKQ